MKIAMVKRAESLTPAYNKDKESFLKLKNDIYVFEVKRDRFLPHHRKYFAILNLVVHNSEKWGSVEELLTALKRHLGYSKKMVGIDGVEFESYGSIRFEVMGQDEFERFYAASLPILAAEIGCTVDDLENNNGEYM